MKLPLYQADAFSAQPFGGNPAAVVPLKKWLPKKLLQQIAGENNLSETVFFVPVSKKTHNYEIRWFTPETEVNLCGHATLAAAFILFTELGVEKKKLVFQSESGLLRVTRKKDWLWLDFPAWIPERVSEYPAELLSGLGQQEVVGVYRNRDWLVELATEEIVQKALPDFSILRKLDRMVIITAPGKEVDFVSRFFAPGAGVDEDPVTGSAHSQLIPFWGDKLGKKEMIARQLSRRGGDLQCRWRDDRVDIGGHCAFYMKGQIRIPD